jgi:murein DD-endopeptidase MepM/ murein hydrolase activator NlpD
MKRLLILLLLAASARAARVDEAILLSERKDGKRMLVSARNTDLRLPRWIQVSLENAQNIQADRGLPLRLVLQPGENRELMALSAIDPYRGSSYSLSSIQGFGNPDANPDLSIAYLLPFEHGTKHAVGQGYLGQATHQGIYALDFDMPEGTTITAARGGLVASVKDDSDSGGASPAFARLGNYIDVLHDDGTWATYAHLKNRGALVREGEAVRAGDPLGLSGQTGQATGPHLHFSVQKARWSGAPETFATPFRIDADTNAFLEEGKYYYGWHPDMPDFARVDASKLDEAALEAYAAPVSGGKVRFREEKIDNRMLLYCANPLDKAVELKVALSESRNVEPSKPLPFIKTVPAHCEVFLLSILMKPQSSYQAAFSYRVAP